MSKWDYQAVGRPPDLFSRKSRQNNCLAKHKIVTAGKDLRHGEVAQLVEQGAVNTQVKGSIPFFSAI
jgi:hypothetical protein